MKRLAISILLPVILAMLLSMLAAGCKTEDYNLRAIQDNKHMISADSTANRTQWRTPSWVTEHGKQWGSTGVLITSIENTFGDSPEPNWLEQVILQGFKGMILVDWDLEYIPVSWGTEPRGSFKELIHKYITETCSFETRVINTSDAIVTFDHPVYGNSYMVRPDMYEYWYDSVYTIVDGFSSQLIANLSLTGADLQIGIFKPYNTADWVPYTEYPSDMATLTADPLDKGYAIDSYDGDDMAEFSAHHDSIIVRMASFDIPIVIYGDRLDTEDYALSERDVVGVFFEDVTTANVSTVLSTVSTYRDAFTPADVTESLLFIAGIKDDSMHQSSSTAYAMLIDDLIQAGVYFTPGANNEYFDYPDYQPGSWWVRVDNDSAWNDNPNNPDYASTTVHPRQLFGVVSLGPEAPAPPIDPEDPEQFLFHATFPGGGWCWASAYAIDYEDIMIIGSDVSGIYDSLDGGLTWGLHNKGLANDYLQDIINVSDIQAVKNSYFEGFVILPFDGIAYIDIPYTRDTTWEWMIGIDNPNYMYFHNYGWANWLKGFSFGSLDWDGNDMLVATGGRQRQAKDYSGFYPTGNVYNDEGDHPEPDIGLHALWRYIYSDAIPRWRPVCRAFDAGIAVADTDSVWVKAWGTYKDVSVAIVGSDTLYAVATENYGPQILIKSGATEAWYDIGSYDFYIPDYTDNDLPDVITAPIWEMNAAKAGNSQAIWNITVTNRGDVYITIQNYWNSGAAWDGDSGLYKLEYADITGVGDWIWVGDKSKVLPEMRLYGGTAGDASIADVGAGNFDNSIYSPSTNWLCGSWTWHTLIEGSSSDPDTVWMGGYLGYNRLAYAEISYTDSALTNTWFGYTGVYDDGVGDYDEFPVDIGLIPDHWGYQMIHEPAVSPSTSRKMFYDASAKWFETKDRGATFRNLLALESPLLAENYYKSAGLDETGVTGIGVLSDGRLVVNRMDVYPTMSESSNWEYHTTMAPNGPMNYSVDDCGDNTSDAFYRGGCGFLEVVPDWPGYDQDIMLLGTLDVQGGEPSKIFWVVDINEDGDFDDEDEWINLNSDANFAACADLTYPEHYTMSGGVAIDAPNQRFWASFKRYTNYVCSGAGAGVITERGVIQYTYSKGAWTLSVIDQAGVGVYGGTLYFVPYRLAYSADENRLFVAGDYVTSVEYGSGGVWFADLDDRPPVWDCIFGEAWTDDPLGDYNNTGYGNVKSIKFSNDESIMYIGTRGASGAHGGIWSTTTIGADADAFYWTQHINNLAVDDALPLVPDLPTPATAYYADRGYDTAEIMSERTCRVTDILVDPFDNDRIWFINGSMGSPNRTASNAGLYTFDTNTETVVRMFPDDDRSWASDSFHGGTLRYTNITNPPRIMWGTHAIGVSWIEYDGSWPEESTTTRFVVMADQITYDTGFEETLEWIEKTLPDPDFIAFCGDTDMGDQDAIITSVFGEDMDWYNALGNHCIECLWDDGLGCYPDSTNKVALNIEYADNAAYITDSALTNHNGTIYSIDYNNVHIAFINMLYGWMGEGTPVLWEYGNHRSGNGYNLISEQMEWLYGDIEFSNSDQILILGHQNLFGSPGDMDSGQIRYPTPQVGTVAQQDSLKALIVAENVKMYVHGHTHTAWEWDEDDVYTFDMGHARGDEEAVTASLSGFIYVTVYEDGRMNMDLYRQVYDEFSGGEYTFPFNVNYEKRLTRKFDSRDEK